MVLGEIVKRRPLGDGTVGEGASQRRGGDGQSLHARHRGETAQQDVERVAGPDRPQRESRIARQIAIEIGDVGAVGAPGPPQQLVAHPGPRVFGKPGRPQGSSGAAASVCSGNHPRALATPRRTAASGRGPTARRSAAPPRGPHRRRSARCAPAADPDPFRPKHRDAPVRPRRRSAVRRPRAPSLCSSAPPTAPARRGGRLGSLVARGPWRDDEPDIPDCDRSGRVTAKSSYHLSGPCWKARG